MPWLALREIVIGNNDCQAELAEARNRFRRFDEAWEGATWLLARNPQPSGSFHSIRRDGVDYFIFPVQGDADAGIPSMYIFYEYDEDEVTIHGINAVDVPRDEQE